MKCLIIDPVHESLAQGLRALGVEVQYCPEIAAADVLQQLSDFEGLVIRSKIKIDESLLCAAPRLRFVARAGSGLDGIDTAALERRGIVLFSAPEGNRDAVAEHTLGLLLALFNKIHICHFNICQSIWNREAGRGIEINGKTVGIIGYGNMGSAFARRLSGFGCRVLSYDRAQKYDSYTHNVSLEELQKEAQIVSLHIPLDPYNRGLCNREYLSRFEHDIFLLNTSRGEILPLEDLVWGLESGKIKGAGLDVLENENFSTFTPKQQVLFQRLIEFPNLVMTPHTAGWTQESYRKISEVLLHKIADWHLNRTLTFPTPPNS